MKAGDWIKTLKAEEKAHEAFRTRAQKVVDRYEDETKDDGRRFNILWSNVETIHPVVYAKSPSPEIRRRYLDRDPAGKKAAELAERAVSYAIDVYDFDSNVDLAIDDYLLAGIGLVRMRYEPYTDKTPGEKRHLQEQFKGYDELENPLYGMFDGDSEVEEWETDDDGFAYLQGEETEELVYEEVVCEAVNWKRFRWQPSPRWEDVGWCAIEHYMDEDELKEKYPEDYKQIPMTYTEKGAKADPDDANPMALIFEIFDKKNSVNIEIADGYDEILNEVEDPLGLEGYYPFPRPLFATLTNGKLIPIPDYVFYQDQAAELDRITQRIDNLTEQLKYRGVYDAAMTELRSLQNLEDGEFMPLSDTAALMAGNQLDLKKAIAAMPLDEIIKALAALHKSREEVKQVIYEITGIADIMRGTTAASETLGAQQLKTQFGSIRMGKRQRQVAQFIRNIVRLKVEIMVENFQPSTLSMMTGIDVMPADPPQNWFQMKDEEKQAFIKKEEEKEEVLAILKNDMMRSYRIDIETDSTIAEDAMQEKQNRIELVTAITGFFKEVGPLVQAGLVPENVATELLGFAVRGFKVGRTLEEVLDEMSEQDDDPRMKEMQQQVEQAKQMLQQQAQEYVEGVKQESGKQIKQLQGQLFEAQKQNAIKGAVNEAKMFETQTKGQITKETEEFKTRLAMLLEVFRAEIQQKQDEPIQRIDQLGQAMSQFAQILQAQDQEYRGVFENLQGQIGEAKAESANLLEWIKKPAKVMRDKNGRVTGAVKE